jgi:peptide/nickel transport system substrate-binding protein
MRRRVIWGSALAVLALGAFGLTGQPLGVLSAPQSGGTLTIGVWQEPDFLTWVIGNSCFTCTAIMQAMWEPPLESDKVGNLVPSQLVSIPTIQNGGVSADGKTIKLKLKPGLKWSDGQPITMKDFIFTWKLVTNKDTGAVFDQGWSDIASVAASGDLDATVTMKRVFAPFVGKALANPFAFWLPEHALAGKNFREWSRAPSVTSGPFKFAEWVSGDHITVERNPNFMTPARLDRVVFKLITDRSAMIAQLKAGALDAGLILDPPDIAAVKGDANLVVYADAGGNIEHWELNERDPQDLSKPHPILSDRRVRAALLYGTNRVAVVKSLLLGVPQVAVNWLDNTAWFNKSLRSAPYDPAKAGALLDEAGWKMAPGGVREKNGKPLHLMYATTSGNNLREQMEVVFQQQVKAIGVNLEIKNYRPAELFGAWSSNGVLTRGRFDVAQFADATIGADPDISHFYLTSQVVAENNPAGYNTSGISDSKLDEALQCELGSMDLSKRKTCLNTAQQIVYDQSYTVFLYDKPDILIASKKFHEIQHVANPYAMWLGNTAQWWIEK